MSADDGLFWAAFRDAPLGMALLDARGVTLAVNPTLTAMMGSDAETSTATPFLSFVHVDDADRVNDALDHVGTPGGRRFQLGARLTSTDGDVVWVRITITRPETTTNEAALIVQVEDLNEHHRAQGLMARQSRFDELTGLPNRSLLMERVEAALSDATARGGHAAALFLDVDHFNLVNDSLGNDSGDSLLAIIASRIERAARPSDTVARLSGDEFVVLFASVSGLAETQRLAGLVAAAVATPVSIADHELVPTISGGLVVSQDTHTAESLIRDADTAMFVAKERGRARIEVFAPEFRDNQLSKLSIEGELRVALREGELAVHYQPVVDLATGEIAAYEALVRWNHPTRGLLLPETFIEIAEDANLVVPLGDFVLMEACQFLARNTGYAGRIFVNVSTRQIGVADLAQSVRAALDATGVDPSRVCLEITESGMLMATGAARADLDAIAALGVDLIIDDFGTGYSALSSVLQNPVSGLKLAREFTVVLGDGGAGDRISTAMASLVRGLGMYGVVEGIETREQLDLARQHGWQYGQGFLIARPSPEEALDHGATAPTSA